KQTRKSDSCGSCLRESTKFLAARHLPKNPQNRSQLRQPRVSRKNPPRPLPNRSSVERPYQSVQDRRLPLPHESTGRRSMPEQVERSSRAQQPPTPYPTESARTPP